MIDLKVDSSFIEDLKDDILINEDCPLYTFVGHNPVRAFYLGAVINALHDSLNQKQRYLYSKELRHIPESLKELQNQLDFWNSKFTSKETSMIEYASYLLNNFFFNSERDMINLALFLGITYSNKISNV